MSVPSPAPGTRRGRLVLLAVAALFLGPLALAFYAYYGGALTHGRLTAHGELVTPAVPLDDGALIPSPGGAPVTAPLHGHWSLVTFSGPDCEATCRATLATTRALRLALGHNIDRVERLLIVEGPCCSPPDLGIAADPKLNVAWLREGAAARFTAPFPGHGTADGAGRIYVVDPLGNLMMSYPAGTAPKGIVHDLERLLRLSHIG